MGTSLAYCQINVTVRKPVVNKTSKNKLQTIYVTTLCPQAKVKHMQLSGGTTPGMTGSRQIRYCVATFVHASSNLLDTIIATR